MNNQLKEAQKWEKMFKSLIGYDKGIKTFKEIAKVNMEKLGCGRIIRQYELEDGKDIEIECDFRELCEDCQKAKEIYEKGLE